MKVGRSLVSLVLLVGVIAAPRVVAREQAKDHADAPKAHAAGQHEAVGHTHAEAAKLKNPVPGDAKSIEEGRQAYTTHCAACHGPAGQGDGKQAAKFTPRPSNLVDAQWKHGPSDGEIFTVIRTGIPKTSMATFSKKLSERQTWAVINFIRSVGAKPEATHAH